MISVVDSATVEVKEENYRVTMGKGLLIYVGISKDDIDDYQQKIEKFVDKIQTLKCFHVDGKINSSIGEVGGEIMLISNFTLYGRADKGQKLDFSQSADFASAEKIYNELVAKLSEHLTVYTGVFGGYMEVSSVNAGPINLVLDY